MQGDNREAGGRVNCPGDERENARLPRRRISASATPRIRIVAVVRLQLAGQVHSTGGEITAIAWGVPIACDGQKEAVRFALNPVGLRESA
jgi:hypothetical protein